MPTQRNRESDSSSRTADRREDVINPSHYRGKIEVIDFIEAYDLNFNLGNVVKYTSRAGRKEEEALVTDLSKALWYLRKELHRLGHGPDPRDDF